MSQNRRIVLAVLLSLAVIIPATAQNRSTWERRPAQIHASDARGALSFPSTDSPNEVVTRFLTSHGHDAATARTIADDSTSRSRIGGQSAGFSRSDNGLTHVRADQRVDGLVVYGSYVKAAINEQGQVVHLIENLAPVPAHITRAAINEDEAVRAAIGRIHPGVSAPRHARTQDGTTVSTENSGYFYVAPKVDRVLVSMQDGSMHEGFLVETWTRQKNLLNHTLVSGEGQILNVELRTNNDQYFVYNEDPGKGGQALVSGPTPVTPVGTVPSPNGWLNTGTHKTINITGNNVHAYLDASPANNHPDSGGTNVTNGQFTTVSNLRRRAEHDRQPRRGGAEPFLPQQPHPRHVVRGRLQRVRAELPGEQLRPRRRRQRLRQRRGAGRRRYGQRQLRHARRRLESPHADVPLDRQAVAPGPGRRQHLRRRGRGVRSGPDQHRQDRHHHRGFAGGRLHGHLHHAHRQIAVIDRGTCAFTVKVKNAQLKGAIGVIVANNAGDGVMSMGGTDGTVTIPSVFVGQTDGAAVKAAAGSNTTIRLTTPAPLQRDGDLDADIVFHEYGHGLTWRMIGSMSGAMSGAIGEGMGDVLAIVLNGDDRMGEYSASDPLGIRSSPYATHPRTYGDVTGAGGVHFDGEVYGAIGWKLLELYTAGGLTNTDLLRDLVQGMRFTPAAPNFQQMRDGILAATTTNDCKVWTAFAQYGVGQGATSSVSGSVITVTESFTVPAGVCP